MSHREKIFCICDGCDLEAEVTSPVVPDDWVMVTKQKHGSKSQHFCGRCWSIGIIAIHNHDANKGSA